MGEDFELPVNHRGVLLMLPARLLAFGYSTFIEVDVEEVPVRFERDDSGDWRALVSMEDRERKVHPDVGLLQSIAVAIEDVLK